MGLINGSVIAQTTASTTRSTSSPPVTDAPNASFALKTGDRVVFLGNSLFENDLQYGYLELALTTRWPDRVVTFRNLGWTGDNVFGDARSEITNPPTAYEMLLDQLTKAQPTVVFLAYGGVEAQDGEAGLPRFQEGLTKLLDKIDQLGATSILLSPIPVMTGDSVPDGAQRNAMLERYSAAIAKTATERGKRFIDLFKPMQDLSKTIRLTDNGIHLNETGYYHLVTMLEKNLGLASRNAPIMIDLAKNRPEAAAPAKLLTTNKTNSSLIFTIDESFLPLPRPRSENSTVAGGQILKINALKKGFYTLRADNMDVVTASAKQWEEGVGLRQGPAFNQVEALRQLILKKNNLFFFQYRPLNRTYILGFRSYEQGRHVKELDEQNILITYLEGQIALLRTPPSSVYQLIPLK